MILVAGDAMRDVYWHGEVTRISPEAPVAVVSVKRVEERAGAAANVAANVWAMGVTCREEFGSQERQVTKTRLMARGQQVMRVDFDYPQEPIEAVDFGGVSVAIFVDYGKGSLGHVGSLIREARSRAVTVLVDPKGYDYERYRGADVVKPNLDEMRVMVGGWRDETDLAFKAWGILKEAGIGALLLTRASEGMTLYMSGYRKHIPAVAEKVVDVTGAGEAAIAALGVGLHRGYTLEESCVYANKAAGVAVGRFGPAVVTEREVFG